MYNHDRLLRHFLYSSPTIRLAKIFVVNVLKKQTKVYIIACEHSYMLFEQIIILYNNQ